MTWAGKSEKFYKQIVIGPRRKAINELTKECSEMQKDICRRCLRH